MNYLGGKPARYLTVDRLTNTLQAAGNLTLKKGLKNKYLNFIMINNKKVAVIMPAYNAEKTLEKTYNEIPKDIVDEVILTDDLSSDNTVKVATRLNIRVFEHKKNRGYGGNQKTCYQEALNVGADIVIMLHPDYQYTPKLIPAIANMIASGEYDVIIASRILGSKALQGGMPIYKYISNRFLTLLENIIIGQKLSEYHTGYRAFTREVLLKLPLEENSDDFVFDNQMVVQSFFFGFRVGEVSCPTKYFKEASSINFERSVIYGIGVIVTAIKHFLHKKDFMKFSIFDEDGEKLQLRINNEE